MREALAQVPFVAHIDNQKDYEQAMELMDELVSDYSTSKPLIEILDVSIERWEDQAEQFLEFNAAVA